LADGAHKHPKHCQLDNRSKLYNRSKLDLQFKLSNCFALYKLLEPHKYYKSDKLDNSALSTQDTIPFQATSIYRQVNVSSVEPYISSGSTAANTS
ncbi:hypothetical protein V5O48_017881, partial [Marasmius crinis-equi]